MTGALIVLTHVLPPLLDLLGLLLIHPGDFVSGVTKRMQDFIEFRVDGLCVAMLRPLNDEGHGPRLPGWLTACHSKVSGLNTIQSAA